jgi:CheY-like chemotaxis protein
LTTDFEAGLGYVDVDASQIAQVVLNLVLNARDAMPQGGRITLRTRNAEVDRAAARRIGVEMRPGPFVVLEVQDTGTGIPPENLDLIFEPFFTTKHPAAGVGLGLSTVYGIVKQSHGHVAVESEQGAGTTFRVFLPRTHSTPEADVPSAPASAAQVSETLLLVEDEESVRRLARKILERKGYRVIEAGNGEEALERIAALDEPLDLIVTDVVMPRMSGAELARTLRDRGLRVPVLFMSGYADDSRVINDIAAARGTFLEKPFTPDALLRRVRTTLDANPRSGVR